MENWYEQFRNPISRYRPIPFWSWNDELTDDELSRQVREMKIRGLGGFFIHSRIGLITPYLSKEWMDRVHTVIQVAKEEGLEPWLYDEDRWPSGFAGGKVLAGNPSFRQKRLVCEEIPPHDYTKVPDNTTVRIFLGRKKEDGTWQDLKDITGVSGDFSGEREKTILHFRRLLAPDSLWFNNESYLDTMMPEAVEAFLESTYEAYLGEVGEEFGKTIPGIFTDEPNITSWETAGMVVPWTDNLPQYFKDKNGYDLLACLPSLFYPVNNYHRIRYDFWNTLTDLFLKTYTEKLYHWCQAHRLKYTGHYLCEDNLRIQTRFIGAAMPHYEYMHVPGVDHLSRNIVDLITIKQVASVAHQLGKERVLSETYGCGGWALSLEDQKWIGDWEYVLGINLLNPHLSLYSMKGCRKRDFPPSLYYQQPWWEDYHLLNDYFGRLSYMLTRGKFCADLLVIHPLGSAWAVYQPLDNREVDRWNAHFVALCETLCRIHRDYDLGDEKLLEKYGRVNNNQLVLGEMPYQLIILPPGLTLRKTTFKLLREFKQKGGKIIALKPLPIMLEGEESKELKDFLWSDGIQRLEPLVTELWDGGFLHSEKNSQALKETLDNILPSEISIQDDVEQEIEAIYYQHRREGNKHIYFLANTDPQKYFRVCLRLPVRGSLQCWDPLTGKVEELPCREKEHCLETKLEFPPAGSYLLLVDESRPTKTGEISFPKIKVWQELADKWEFRRLDLNALTLDYCRFRIENGNWTEPVPFWKVQPALELVGREVDFSLQYQFLVDLDINKKRVLYLVIELPERYQIFLNGQAVPVEDQGWWRDISFRKIDLGNYVRRGENILELHGRFRRPTRPGTLIFLKEGIEVESCYLIGDFAVAVEEGCHFRLVDEQPVKGGDLVPQGYPFYAGKVSYSQQLNLTNFPIPLYLELGKKNWIVARVVVNGKEGGKIICAPYRVEIGHLLRKGENKLQIEFTNSCRNLLGPHHHREGELLSVSPYSFQDQIHWTDYYNFVPFGLTDRVKLTTIAR